MKKNHKICSFIAIVVLLVFGIVTVNAAQGFQFTFSLPAWGGVANTDFLTANSNYTYSTAHVTKTVNGDKFDVTYQTKYGNNVVTAGSTLTLPAKGNTKNAVWYPISGSSSGAPYSAYTSTTCSGSNTTSLYCGVSGQQYRWYLKNGSVIGGTTTVVSLFTLDLSLIHI